MVDRGGGPRADGDRRRRLRDKHGYAEMTPTLRAKIFGLNGAKVYGVARTVRKASNERDPHFMTYGPKTRREFLALLAASPSP